MEKNNLSDTPSEKYEGKEVKIDIEEEFNLSDVWIEKDRCKRVKLTTDVNVKNLKLPSQCSIYKVPENLRKIKKEAYTPQLISIGPFHHGESALAKMEKQKIRYKEDFGKRLSITEEGWQGLINFIEGKEQDIRDCYDEEITHLESEKFRKMVLFDAIFIIELFLKNSEGIEDSLLNNACYKSGIWLDLQLIENQLPFFVLKELYVSFFLGHRELLAHRSFEILSSEFFGVSYEGEFQHFVDLRRNFLLKNLPCRDRVGRIDDLPSAVKLHQSGVKFESIKDSELRESVVEFESIKSCGNLLDIKLRESHCCCLPYSKVYKLQIPHITIEDDTECLFRNMMALEQCHYSSETYICNYIDLLDSLINTKEDVDLLVEKKIISNCVGDHDKIAKMFNELCLQISLSGSRYIDICEDLKRHHKRWWNRTRAKLIKVYFSDFWRGTGTIAAFILLVLTLLQTIYTMKG